MTDDDTLRIRPAHLAALQELANRDQVPVRFTLDTALRLGLAEMPNAAQWVARHERLEQEQATDNPMTSRKRLGSTPKRMSGTPCFRNSRLPVENLFEWLAAGVPLQEYLDDFHLDRRAVAGVLLAAGKMLSDQLENPPSGAPNST